MLDFNKFRLLELLSYLKNVQSESDLITVLHILFNKGVLIIIFSISFMLSMSPELVSRLIGSDKDKE